MPEYSNSDSTARDVALLLRNADRLVKEKQYQAALEAIAQARAVDPRNPYAIAYEERVKFLMKQPDEAKKPAAAPAQRLPVPAASPNQAQRTLTSSLNEEELKRAAIEQKINALITSAEQFRMQGELQRASDEIGRALLLNPTHERLKRMRNELTAEAEQIKRQREEEKLRAEQEMEAKRQQLLKAELERLQREKEARESQEIEAKMRARQSKVQEYLGRARQCASENRFDAALRELGFITVLDPENAEAKDLRASVAAKQEQLRREEEERRRQQEEIERQKRAALDLAVKKQVADALDLAMGGKFAEALRVLTRAYALDPGNAEIAGCERDVMAMQEEALRVEEQRRKAAEQEELKQREEESRRIEEEERSRIAEEERLAAEQRKMAARQEITDHLAAARMELAGGKFDNALAEIAFAFLVDPFDQEVTDLEREILDAQNAQRTDEGQGAMPFAGEVSPEDTAATVAAYVADAHRHRMSGNFDAALDQLAMAFILDPLNEQIRECEAAIQADREAAMNYRASLGGQADVKEGTPEAHCEAARAYLASGAFDDALAEVAMGLTIDESNPALRQIEQEIWLAQSAVAQRSQLTEVEQREKEEQLRLIQIHLLAADEFQKKNDFERALDEVTKAYVIDPMNPETRKTEIRIRQNQARAVASSVQPLKLVYTQGDVADGTR